MIELHSTVLHAFRAAIEQRPDQLALRVIGPTGDATERTYAQLGADVRRAAGGLLSMGLARGDRVVLCAPSSIVSISVHLAAMSLGILPVLVAPPRNGDSTLQWNRVEGIAARVRACAVCVHSFPDRVPSKHDYTRLDQIAAGPSLEGLGPLPRPEDPAHLQSTARITGEPRITMVDHLHLAANIRAVGAALDVRPQDHFYMWLPLHHDMGLLALLGALHWQRPITLTDPATFLQHPIRHWFQWMSRYGCTITAAPTFAYLACARIAAQRQHDGLDLSACRLAIWGASPVSPSGAEQFLRTFGPYGYRASATLPASGLIAATLAITVANLRASAVADAARVPSPVTAGRAPARRSADTEQLRAED